MTAHYKIIFKGKILLNFSEAMVKEKLAILLKTDVQKVEQLFTGKEYTLKKNLTPEQANQYKTQLEKIGMHVEITAPLSDVALQSSALSDYTNSTKNHSKTNPQQINNRPPVENFYNPSASSDDDTPEDRSLGDVLHNGFKLPIGEIMSESINFNRLGDFLLRFSPPFLLITILNGIVVFITDLIFTPSQFTGQSSVIGLILQSLFMYVSAFGLYKITLDYIEDEVFSVDSIFWGFKNILALLAQFGWILLYMMPLIIGIFFFSTFAMLLFITGLGQISIILFALLFSALFLAIYMMFFLIPVLFVRTPNRGAHDTIKASYKITSKQFLDFLKLYSIIGLIGLALSLPSFIVFVFSRFSGSFILLILGGLLGFIALCVSSGLFCLSTTIACDKIFRQRSRSNP